MYFVPVIKGRFMGLDQAQKRSRALWQMRRQPSKACGHLPVALPPLHRSGLGKCL